MVRTHHPKVAYVVLDSRILRDLLEARLRLFGAPSEVCVDQMAYLFSFLLWGRLSWDASGLLSD